MQSIKRYKKSNSWNDIMMTDILIYQQLQYLNDIDKTLKILTA